MKKPNLFKKKTFLKSRKLEAFKTINQRATFSVSLNPSEVKQTHRNHLLEKKPLNDRIRNDSFPLEGDICSIELLI